MSKKAYQNAYPKEFRHKVVQLVQVSERSVREVAEEFDISPDSVRRWAQQAEREQGSRQRREQSRAGGAAALEAGERATEAGAGDPVKSATSQAERRQEHDMPGDSPERVKQAFFRPVVARSVKPGRQAAGPLLPSSGKRDYSSPK